MQQRIKQRGIIDVILVGVFILAVGGGLMAMVHTIKKEGEEVQRKRDEPILAACEGIGAKKPADCATSLQSYVANQKVLLDANKGFEQDLADLAAQRDACNKKVTWLAKQGERMDAANKARKPIEDKKLAEIDDDMAQMVAALGLPDKGGTCEQREARRKAQLEKIRDQRLRDYGPATPSKDDSVNIRERR